MKKISFSTQWDGDLFAKVEAANKISPLYQEDLYDQFKIGSEVHMENCSLIDEDTFIVTGRIKNGWYTSYND